MAAPKEKSIGGILGGFARKIFIDNLGLKLFSLLIALLLWLFVLGAEDVNHTVEVPIFFTLPDELVLVSDVPNRVNILVTGPWATIKSWNTKDLEVEVNLTKAGIGPTVVYLEESRFRLPPALSLVRVNPAQITVSLAMKKRKIVPIIPVHVGSPASGYRVQSIVAIPDKIEIEGAESDVMIVDEVLTEEIDVTNHHNTFSVTSHPVRLSKNIVFPSKEPIQVTIVMKKDLTERHFPAVTVVVRNSKYPAKVTPPTISLNLLGPRKIIEKLKPESVRAYVDASKEEGDKPGSETVRDVEFDPLPEQVKIKAGTYTVKLKIQNAEPARRIGKDQKKTP